MAATAEGKSVLPRAAALLNTQPITDVIAIDSPVRFKRPVYAGNAISTVEFIGTGPVLLSVRTTTFAPANSGSLEASPGGNSPGPATGIAEVVTLAQDELAPAQVPHSILPAGLGAQHCVFTTNRLMHLADCS
jgi:electron transfer flavoprotein alpha subunit